MSSKLFMVNKAKIIYDAKVQPCGCEANTAAKVHHCPLFYNSKTRCDHKNRFHILVLHLQKYVFKNKIPFL